MSRVGVLRSSGDSSTPRDAYCRRCRKTFARPFPRPYGPICPYCIADGDIVTLTDVRRNRECSGALKHARALHRQRITSEQANDGAQT